MPLLKSFATRPVIPRATGTRRPAGPRWVARPALPHRPGASTRPTASPGTAAAASDTAAAATSHHPSTGGAMPSPRRLARGTQDAEPKKPTAGPELTSELVLEAVADYRAVTSDVVANARASHRQPAVLMLEILVPRPESHFGDVDRTTSTGLGRRRVRETRRQREVLRRCLDAPIPAAVARRYRDLVEQATELVEQEAPDLAVVGASQTLRWSRYSRPQVSVSFADPREARR